MKIKYLSLFITFFIISLTAFSQQDTVFNQTDASGKKQGYWKKFYPNNKIQYLGFFKNDKPSGLFYRYYQEGGIQSVMNFDNTGSTAYAVLFYNTGDTAAIGKFVNQKKDSTWVYYSYYSKKITSVENYRLGVLENETISYFENGKPSEIITYKNGIKEGKWEQYFDNGQLKVSCTYVNNKLNGKYKAFFPDGLVHIIGNYSNNEKDGSWHYFKDTGEKSTQINFSNGIPDNLEELERIEQEYFEEIEDSKGRFKEPTINDVKGF